MASDIKERFAQETNRKKTEISNLLETIKSKRKEMEKGMSGSVRSSIIYDKFDEIEQKLNILIDECDESISDYKDAEYF